MSRWSASTSSTPANSGKLIGAPASTRVAGTRHEDRIRQDATLGEWASDARRRHDRCGFPDAHSPRIASTAGGALAMGTRIGETPRKPMHARGNVTVEFYLWPAIGPLGAVRQRPHVGLPARGRRMAAPSGSHRSSQKISSGSELILTGMLLHPTPRLTIIGPFPGTSNRPRECERDNGPPAPTSGVPSRRQI